MYRFFIKEEQIHDGMIEICGSDVNHIKNVLRMKTGDKVYAVCMGKSIAMFRIGKEPLENGMNILGAHIDSPRIDVKQNPLYENEELAYLDTHYYGGIKKYQWVTIPLAIHGTIAKKDGTVRDIIIGEKKIEDTTKEK